MAWCLPSAFSVTHNVTCIIFGHTKHIKHIHCCRLTHINLYHKACHIHHLLSHKVTHILSQHLHTVSHRSHLSIITRSLTYFTSVSSHSLTDLKIIPAASHKVSQILKLPQQHHTESHRYQLCIITQFHRSHTIIIHVESVRLLLNNVQESVCVKMSMLENIYSHDSSPCLGHMYLPM